MLKENNKHYNVDELFLYSHDLLSEAERFAIDEHLLECEKCRGLFFRLLEEEGAVQEAENWVPKDFTAKLMHRLTCEPVRPRPKKAPAKKLNRRQYIVVYATVASLTLFLSWNGAFSPIAKAGEDLPGKEPAPITEKQEKIADALDAFLTNIQDSSNEAKAGIKELFNNTFKSGGEKQ
ncbi:MAG: zf-HC2 domain-containing protein [Clostridia bacterium]|nr:zf-HC2 domain-containing protein [Clostridia bacterium]